MPEGLKVLRTEWGCTAVEKRYRLRGSPEGLINFLKAAKTEIQATMAEIQESLPERVAWTSPQLISMRVGELVLFGIIHTGDCRSSKPRDEPVDESLPICWGHPSDPTANQP